MEIEKRQQRQVVSHLPFYLKCGAIFLLLSLSVLVIACGTNGTTATDSDNPQVTVTIRFSNGLSSLGTALPYMCGAWASETTPSFNPGSEVPVYAHFVHNVNGNPVGIGGASAQASIEWADGSRDNQAETTTSDGLAVFYFTIPNRPDIVGKNNLVTISFTGPNGQTCKVDNQSQPDAFFTLIVASPTPTVTPSVAPTVEITRPVISPPIITPPFLPPGRRNNSTPTPTGQPPGF
jgi:hypothetical protein